MKILALVASLVITNNCLAQQKFDFKPLIYLTGGSWHMKTAKGITGETWKKINNNELQSNGYRINDKDTILLEKVQLIKKGDDIFYISTVQNQNDGKPVAFKLTENANNQFIFSNPTHDFPQRIVYHFLTQDSLHAWIDGQNNGRLVKQDFYYKRVK